MSDALDKLHDDLRLIGQHAGGTVHLVVSKYDARIYVDKDGNGYRDSEWARAATVREAVVLALAACGTPADEGG